MKKQLINILKAVLLWTTVASVTLFIIGGFETLITNGWLEPLVFWIVLDTILVFTCIKVIKANDIDNLSGVKWFEDHIKPE